jgi:undecaprenyl-diphosphatase
VLDLDKQALIWINSHHPVVLDALLAPIAYAGEAGVLWFAVSLGLLIFGKQDAKTTGLTLALTIVLVDRLIAYPLGVAFYRTRPYLALAGVRQVGIRWHGTSFPSGHAHSVWIAAIILSDRYPRLTAPLLVFALLTCYSRPYFGMHYPLDVVAGSAIGIAAGTTVVIAKRAWARRKAPRQ